MSTRDEKFKQFAKVQQERREREQRRQGGGFSQEYEDIHYTAMAQGSDTLVRIVGLPFAIREQPTDMKQFLMSMLTTDDGGKMRCIWPNQEDIPDWPLWEIFDMVMKVRWEKDNDGKRNKIFVNEKTHPTAYNIVRWNNTPDNTYERGWKPQEMVAMNVIDRFTMDWHKENKHTKVLSKKASEIKSSPGTFYFEPGVPMTTFNRIYDQVVEYFGDWEDYDIVLRKFFKDPWYEAMHASHDIIKLDEGSKPYVVEGPLTEEESSWERYDFDKLYKVTSMIKIENRLIKQIRKIDADFETNFAEKVQDLASDERKELENNQESSAPKAQGVDVTETSESEEELEERKSASREPEERTPTSQASSIPWEELADGTYADGKFGKYEGVPYMTEEEKSMVVGIKEDGQFEYVKTFDGEKVKLYNNKQSGFLAPAQFHIDPYNGDVF